MPSQPPDAVASRPLRTRRQSLDKCLVQSPLRTADMETKLENSRSQRRPTATTSTSP